MTLDELKDKRHKLYMSGDMESVAEIDIIIDNVIKATRLKDQKISKTFNKYRPDVRLNNGG